MNTEDIKAMQRRVGVEDDGFYGRLSQAAVLAHLDKLRAAAPQKWPKIDEASLTAFYGPANSEAQLVNLDVQGLGLKYEGKPVKTVRVHRKVSESLHRVLSSLAKSHPGILAEYAGAFNPRPMRGGSKPSLHARGAAVDFAPDANGNTTHWPSKAMMPFAVMEAFAREGWIPAGAYWSRDAMHFQATQ